MWQSVLSDCILVPEVPLGTQDRAKILYLSPPTLARYHIQARVPEEARFALLLAPVCNTSTLLLPLPPGSVRPFTDTLLHLAVHLCCHTLSSQVLARKQNTASLYNSASVFYTLKSSNHNHLSVLCPELLRTPLLGLRSVFRWL